MTFIKGEELSKLNKQELITLQYEVTNRIRSARVRSAFVHLASLRKIASPTNDVLAVEAKLEQEIRLSIPRANLVDEYLDKLETILNIDLEI